MPNPPRDVHVQVFVHPGAPNGDYHFESSDLPMGKDNFLYFHNCEHDGLYVHYDIQPGSGYVFPDKTIKQWDKEVLWVQQQTGCPTGPTAWGQFQAYDVTPGGATLVVWNKNPKKETFWYTLRVTNDGGTSYLPLDPGGGNENGAVRATMSFSLALVGGAVAGSLITLGVQSLMGS